MTCARYFLLMTKLYQAGSAERAQELAPGSTQAYRDALTRVRSHAEDCQECIAALKSPFPELKGKELHIQSLL